MCERGDLTWIEELGPYGRYVDACMAEKVLWHNSSNSGVPVGNGKCRTLACCCGHGRYPQTIVVQIEDSPPYEIFSQEFIPRTRRFYRKDKDGYYYIPETLETP
jgi:hypothetical protein